MINRQRRVKQLPLTRLRAALGAILADGGLTFRALGVILVSDRRISEYNRHFLGHRGPTDVITFNHRRRQGEVIISVETARRQALEQGHSLLREILVLAVHGALHLSGHDDRTPARRRLMEAATARLLAGHDSDEEAAAAAARRDA